MYICFIFFIEALNINEKQGGKKSNRPQKRLMDYCLL